MASDLVASAGPRILSRSRMRHVLYALCALLWFVSCVRAEVTYRDWDLPPHNYFDRTPTDRFSVLKAKLEAGELGLERNGERQFLLSLLRLLDIPASSQMLVFSTTSLQLSLINPSNPRALYFNEDIYLGFIPGGRIEIVSLDPELGGVFYIFDIPKGDGPLRIERSKRCMNCHAGEDTGFVPGLSIKSVLPGISGGSIDSFRRERTGHDIPLSERFGGWYLTGADDFTNHWGNLIGKAAAGTITKTRLVPGERYRYERYAYESSALLPQLLHEHQAGFVNRLVEASYRARTYLHTDTNGLSTAHIADLDAQAKAITRYMLFADEAPLPPAGFNEVDEFRTDFRKNRKAVNGRSLKDFDLKSRLFRYRCSYMIYSPVFAGAPAAVKERLYARLQAALNLEKPDTEFDYLGAEEKRGIHEILKATVADLPKDW